MTDIITKIEFTTEERRERPRLIAVSIAGVTSEIAATFSLLLGPSKAAEIDRLYLTNPQPKIELTAWLGELPWTATGKLIGIEKHSTSSTGDSVWDVTFEPDDKGTLVSLKLRIQQKR